MWGILPEQAALAFGSSTKVVIAAENSGGGKLGSHPQPSQQGIE
jgi:glutamate dehydrogenase/leucine dehydrogenase